MLCSSSKYRDRFPFARVIAAHLLGRGSEGTVLALPASLLGIGLGRQVRCQTAAGLRTDVQGPARLPILSLFFFGSVLARAYRSRAVQKIDRNHTHCLRMLDRAHGHRELQEPLGANKVDLEFRAEWITPPGDPMNLGTRLAK
jgi:hypothetical protein